MLYLGIFISLYLDVGSIKTNEHTNLHKKNEITNIKVVIQAEDRVKPTNIVISKLE